MWTPYPTLQALLVFGLMLPQAACKQGQTQPVASVSEPAPCVEAKSNDKREEAPERMEGRDQRPKLVRAAPLPQVARLALRGQMSDHGDDMEDLLWAALMLDHESTAAISGRMGKAPKLSRPPPGDLDSINALLPSEFFALQDTMHSSVARLRDAAENASDQDLSAEYSKVVETCIRCHSLYLRFPAKPEK